MCRLITEIVRFSVQRPLRAFSFTEYGLVRVLLVVYIYKSDLKIVAGKRWSIMIVFVSLTISYAYFLTTIYQWTALVIIFSKPS